MPAPAHFAADLEENFFIARKYYGEIDIPLSSFSDYVWAIARKHFDDSAGERAVIEFAKRLYLRDLYLASGCVHKSERAWVAFDLHYRKFIGDLVRFCYRHGADNEEIADLVMVSLYFNDRSGRQRIASYDGRSSLATWLRVIVINRAINDRNEKRPVIDEEMGDVPDCRALTNLDSALRAQRYADALGSSLEDALQEISEKERLMLLWRYEQNLQLGEIADLMGIHQSNVTRQMLRLQTRLRERVIKALASQYRMSASAIEECLGDAVENPQISIPILRLLKDAPKHAATIGSSLGAADRQAAGSS